MNASFGQPTLIVKQNIAFKKSALEIVKLQKARELS
jgi:hypothetical protein